MDVLHLRRFLFDVMPRSVLNGLIERQLNSRFDHALYGLKPVHRFNAQHIMVNDELPNHIASGAVVIKSNVRRLTEMAVEFEDGSIVDDVDVVIYATGYVFGFPFVDHPAFVVKNNKVNLFKFAFPPDIHPATITVIGCLQPIGAIFPLSEQQCRWAVRVFKVSRMCCVC